MHVLITGGSGFIGQHLITSFAAKHDEINALVHHHAIKHSRCESITSLNAIDRHEKFDVIINLAGAKINKHWSRFYQQTLIDSRVHTTSAIVKLINRLTHPPKNFISGSAVTMVIKLKVILMKTQSAMMILCMDSVTYGNVRLKSLITPMIKTYIIRLGIVLGHGGGFLNKYYRNIINLCIEE